MATYEFMQKQFNFTNEIIVDNFAGGGGASTGIELATGRSVDIAINHDPAAIAMHKTNHPSTEHYCESVWDVNPREAVGGRATALCWFSPDCKHFSKAKGGKPVEKNIRGLAWIVLKWAGMVRPRVIILENVEEFQGWGPLRKGKPIKNKKGETFVKWKAQLESLGYKVDHKELRACDYGAPTIRKRFFLIARCDGKPIIWPQPTHGDPNSLEVKSGKLKPWRTAAEIIDWVIPCPSIFERKRPLAENTMRRIARGLKKFVFDNPKPFVIKVNHQGEAFRGQQVDEPMQTITAKNGWGIVTPFVAQIGQTGSGDNKQYSMDTPLTTVVSKVKHLLITPIISRQFGQSVGHSIEDPLGTITAGGGGKSQLVAAFLAQYHSESSSDPRGQTLDRPILTIDTQPRYALVSSHLIKFRGTNIGHPTDQPLHTITAGGMHLGEVRAFLLKYYGADIGQKCNEPLHTVTTKDRFGLVTVQGQEFEIVDIGMRMLEPRELFAAQGFPADFIIDRDYNGNRYPKSAQVARCGNAVPPPFAKHLVRANLPELCYTKQAKAQ